MDKFSTNQYFLNLDKYFRLANYLSATQLYLLDNPLLERDLRIEDVKKKIVGHWGTVPGQNFVYAHCNRVINKYNLDMILISGPGHGGNFFVSNSFIEGTYTEVYPKVNQSYEGLKLLNKQFSFAGGIPSHVAPETPGSMHEGGELGYSLAHAYGAVFDNPNLIVTTIVGDGEAETGPLATAWQSNKFVNPIHDGAVLPILHLNGYKINNPTVLSRISKEELIKYFQGMGYKPYIVEGKQPMQMHKAMAKAMDSCISDILKIQSNARKNNDASRPMWPMIILRTPKGWTGPKVVDEKPVEDTYRAHQVPIPMTKPEHLQQLQDWLRSYNPQELFNGYEIRKEILEICPKGKKRMSANPVTNGGLLLKELKLPNIKDYEVKFNNPGEIKTQDMLELSGYLKDVIKLNENNKNFRIFGPDEAMSNRLYKIFEADKKQFNAEVYSTDDLISSNGRIMDAYLSEHCCEGWLEGYILTGRHGIFHSYEAFSRVVDSMISQHAKWLKVCNEIKWRKPISSLNLLLSSNVWQQDHNGYTHLDPGMLDHVCNKKADVSRIYLPYDANSLISTIDHCLKSKNYINVVVASKHPSYQWLNMEQTIKHCSQGVSRWEFASTDNNKQPDLIMACCGDTPTLECLAATKILKEYFKELKIRFINVVDLMKLQSNKTHPHGLSDEEYDKLFTTNKPIVFCFHGHPSLIHELTYNRKNRNLHVKGYIEEGTITTPFDMRVQNKIDRYNLVLTALKYINVENKEQIEKEILAKLDKHKKYIKKYGVDMPEIANWKWED